MFTFSASWHKIRGRWRRGLPPAWASVLPLQLDARLCTKNGRCRLGSDACCWCMLCCQRQRRGGLHILTVATSVDLPSSPIVLRRFDVWPLAAVGHTRMTGGHRVLLYDDCIIIIIMALRWTEEQMHSLFDVYRGRFLMYICVARYECFCLRSYVRSSFE